MRNSLRVSSFIFLSFISVGTLLAQDLNDNADQVKSKREKRIEAKQAKEDRKIMFNSKELVLLMSQQDLVIKDDGVGRGLQVQSGITNFFRIVGDTLTFQKIRAEIKGTALLSDRDVFKVQGLVRSVEVMEGGNEDPRLVQISYIDMFTLEPHRALIYVHANRFEVRNDDGSGVFIRGKLTTNEDAKVLEIGQNSSDVLLNRPSWKSGRKATGGIDLRYYRGN